ncbi:MAG: translational GTPase TypA [Candidatus Moranbacteria bacterium CG_4_9_14_3_um_filter_45_14]|nr:MAG: GTP-binding protein TypA [Candidatus Moranbacteria bacterium CG2_30_45_14]PJA86040.1 MAG: translational GTPase TypA [Candidatus Moranbacteria bacterium CG_4_9_14_3_um_filter_45_14]
MEIRNIAIIAHVDHGKTTLTDALMRQTGMVTDASVSMDSNALEQERGITIYAKNASLFWKDTKINIVDTPGHADFGSEVERVLRSIDSVVLVVDAQEGPMPQTRFVLKKSLELGLKPIVVLNKIDKPAARPEEVKEMVYELFLDLGANDEQLDFKTVYAIARQGIAKLALEEESENLFPLLDTILSEVAPAKNDTESPLRAQPFNLGYDSFVGRLAIARVYEGKLKVGDNVLMRNKEGKNETGRIVKLFTFRGSARVEADEVEAGDIVMIAGLLTIEIGDTICISPEQEMLPAIDIDEPTISLNFIVNDSPFAGREGKFVTNKQLRERLQKELEINVGLHIDFSDDHYKVYGRGELHVAILLENMRREGYEVQVSQPQVIIKEIDGVKSEPFEEVTVECPLEVSGTVIEKMGKRKGIMMEMKEGSGGFTRLIFEVPTRGLLGYRGEFMVDTRGEGTLYTRVLGFRPFVGEIKKRDTGSMVSMATGKALAFSLNNLQERGTLYISPSTEIYEGMVVGNVTKGTDMAVNPIKGKAMSNMRSSGADEAIKLVPPLEITIERGLEIILVDEYLEITPHNVRLRKQFLTETDRTRAGRKG